MNKHVTISLYDFANVAAIRHAASKDKNRPKLNGVALVRAGGTLIAFATNSYVMAERTINVFPILDREQAWGVWVDAGDLAAASVAFTARGDIETDSVTLRFEESKSADPLGVEAVLVPQQADLFETDSDEPAQPATYRLRIIDTYGDFAGFDVIDPDHLAKRGAPDIAINPDYLRAAIKTAGNTDTALFIHPHAAKEPILLTHHADPGWRAAIQTIYPIGDAR